MAQISADSALPAKGSSPFASSTLTCDDAQDAPANTREAHKSTNAPATHLVWRQGFGWVERPVETAPETEWVYRSDMGWVEREVGR